MGPLFVVDHARARVILKLKMTMGLLLRAALLIMVGLVVMEMASSGMSNSEQKKVPVEDETADHKVESSQRNKRNVRSGAERAKRYANAYTTTKANNKWKTTKLEAKKTTKKSKIKVTKRRNLRPTSKRTKRKMTKKPEMAETMKKFRATTTDTTITTKETMKKLKAKKMTKKPEMGETAKKLMAKEKANKPAIAKSGKGKDRAPTTTMAARKKTKEPAMETSIKSEEGEIKRNLKLKSTSKAMKKTKMSGRGKSMKPRATVKTKGMTMKPGKVTTMMLGGERVKRAANDTKTTPKPNGPMTSGVSDQKFLLPLSLMALISIVMKSI